MEKGILTGRDLGCNLLPMAESPVIWDYTPWSQGNVFFVKFWSEGAFKDDWYLVEGYKKDMDNLIRKEKGVYHLQWWVGHHMDGHIFLLAN